jgi:hypothetical protein
VVGNGIRVYRKNQELAQTPIADLLIGIGKEKLKIEI